MALPPGISYDDAVARQLVMELILDNNKNLITPSNLRVALLQGVLNVFQGNFESALSYMEDTLMETSDSAATALSNAILTGQLKSQAQTLIDNAMLAVNPQGEWNPISNTPTLSATPVAGSNGTYYEITETGLAPFSGSNFTSGSTTLSVGGRLIKKSSSQYFYQKPSDLGFSNSLINKSDIQKPPIKANLAINSAALGTWAATGLTATQISDYANGNTGIRLTESAANEQHFIIGQNVSIVAGLPFMYSVYIKQGTKVRVGIELSNSANWGGSGSPALYFDAIAGNIVSTTSFVSSSGVVKMDNGYYRVFMVSTTHSTGSTAPRIRMVNNTSTGATYLGDGVSYCDFCFPQISNTNFLIPYTPSYASGISQRLGLLTSKEQQDAWDLKVSPSELAAGYATKAMGVGYTSTLIPGSNNLLNAALSQGSFYMGSTGNLVATTATYSVSDFIEWKEATQFVAAKTGVIDTVFNVCQFNASKVFIAGSYQGTDVATPINKASGASFFRVTYRVATTNQINYGATPLAYDVWFPATSTNVIDKDGSGNPTTAKPNLTDSDFVSFMSSYLKKNYLDKAILQSNGIWASYNIITVKKDGTGNFTNLFAAVNSITDASPSNWYEVQVFDDHYAYQKSDYTAVVGLSYFALMLVKDYVKVRGMGSMKTIYSELPVDSTALEFSTYETAHFDGSGAIENLKIVASRNRYPLHYERSNATINHNASALVIDCEIVHLGCQDVVVGTRWAQPDAWGSGTTTGVQFEFINTKIMGARHGFRAHTNTLSINPNRYKFKNCILGSLLAASPGWAMYMDNLGFTEARFVDLSGVQLIGGMFVSTEVYNAVLLNKVMPSIKISGNGKNAFYYRNSQNVGTALRVTSSSTGLTSIIKVVQDDAMLFGIATRQDGSLGLKGSVFGDNELIDSGTDKRNLIGHRLGDCTTVNKVLILNIDGTNRTVTFNQNYSGGNYAASPLIDSTVILSTINTQLGSFAAADYFKVNLEYFPELSDSMFYKGNTSSTVFIPRGSCVKFVGLNQCRICVANDIPDGVAIDDIPVSSTVMKMGRIIKNTIVSKTERFTPLFEAGSDTFVEGDCFRVSANGKLEKDTAAKDSFIKAMDTSRILIK